MKIGTYFAYWAKEWQVDYFPYLDKAADAGFDVLEISSGIWDLSEKKLKELRIRAEDKGLILTVCLGIPKHLNVSSDCESVRRAGVDYINQLIKKMDMANIRKIGGILYAYWPCDYTQPVNKEKAREISIASVREMADFANDYGIEMEMETVNRFEQFMINDAAEAVSYVKDVGRDNVKVMLDSFHMNIEEDSMSSAIRTAGKYLGHFHIGENNRKVPGKGRMPWQEMADALKEINYQGYVVMEPFVRMGGGVGSDIKVWRDLSGNASDAQLDADIRESCAFCKSIFR
ncbi:MAG: sugar phosphate isomerase/epimerase family protein [Candidatus Excrementavichristensenella sp.]|jgi:D-psicose/D-tagatose/L-ribulose 3-epimerase